MLIKIEKLDITKKYLPFKNFYKKIITYFD